jgi:hypothetical protein
MIHPNDDLDLLLLSLELALEMPEFICVMA